MLYFDHNATHPISPSARQAWLDATERFIGNPSALHRLGTRADRALEEAREKAAAFLGCKPGEIIWTSGATESNNTVLHHYAATSALPAWVSAIEHPSVLEPTRRWFGKRRELIPATARGVIDLDWLTQSLAHSRPALVCVMAANNETGVVQPWREVRDVCRAAGVPFFCDAAQWIGKLPAAELGQCDVVSGCAHKFGGPPGVGFLKCPPKMRAYLHGGSQEGNRRAGTENVPGVLAMMAAWEERERAIAADEVAPREAARDEFIAKLREALPETVIVGGESARLWNTVSALMPGGECRARWVVKLDKQGCSVSTGSACASGKATPSHVLAAMGILPDDADRVVRFSAGWETEPEDWQALLQAIQDAARELAV